MSHAVPVQIVLTPVQTIYVAVFALGALGCWLAAVRAGRVSHRDTRIGLIGLLVLCGSWAAGTGVRLLVPDLAVSRTVILFELVVGLAAVGAWLYFASAYTGQTYHRKPLYRRTAVGLFLVITAVKLTNPLHGLYVTTTLVRTPFPHLVVGDFGLHLAVMTLAYALVGIGFYMLYEMLADSRAPTATLAVPVALAGLPVVLNVLGQLGVAGLLALSYEPLGVAAFGIGVLYFTEATFETARWTRHQRVLDEIGEVVVIVDTEGRIRDFNTAAERVFPAIGDAVGRPLSEVCPDVTRALALNDDPPGGAASLPDPGSSHDRVTDPEPDLVELARDGETRYYLPSAADLTHDSHLLGQAIVCTDVTTVERQRRELHRQNEQLDGFSAAVAHELRNTLAVVHGHLRIIEEAIAGAAGAADADLADAVRTSIDTTDRMTRIVDDLTTLAQHAQTVESPASVEFREAFSGVGLSGLSDEVTVELEGDGRLKADPDRVEELVRQAARLAATTGGTTLRIALGDGELVFTTDGDPIPEGKEADLFAYGTAVPHANAGMAGPNVQAIARAHGWEVSVDEEYRDGIRIRIAGVQGTAGGGAA